MTLAPGSTLGPYTITAELGHGGMGVVYTAQDPRLKRQVAIKLLTPDLTRDETAKQRFLQEAQTASALDHPNICTIHEINETPDGQLYLVMAYDEGETLKEWIERGPLALDEAVDIATQVGRGLAEAHGAGIVHRDIKPANLLIATSGVVKLVAVDMDSGDSAYRKTLGVSDVWPAGMQDTGRLSTGGVVLTASGLTFVGGTDDGRFRAFATATGEQLWELRLPSSVEATPITYLGADGRQFVTVVSTGGGLTGSEVTNDEIIAFALPMN